MAGKYENKEKRGFKKERTFETLSQKKESHPNREPLTIWGHIRDDNQ
jgi:hypothetical protein